MRGKNGRQKRALDRLEDQIASKRMSDEFQERIVGLPEDKQTREITRYWQRKQTEVESLRSRIQSY